jgi:hypothetical protein
MDLTVSQPSFSHQIMKYGVVLVIKDRQIDASEKVSSQGDEYKFISGMAVYDR